jgi:hypothetical protein
MRFEEVIALRSEALVELEIDRAVYLVDEITRTYRYLRRNSEWRHLDPEANERNKRHLVGYTRIFPDGRRKTFTYRPPYTTKRASEEGDTSRTGGHSHT